jgi:hypothetical protein
MLSFKNRHSSITLKGWIDRAPVGKLCYFLQNYEEIYAVPAVNLTAGGKVVWDFDVFSKTFIPDIINRSDMYDLFQHLVLVPTKDVWVLMQIKQVENVYFMEMLHPDHGLIYCTNAMQDPIVYTRIAKPTHDYLHKL